MGFLSEVPWPCPRPERPFRPSSRPPRAGSGLARTRAAGSWRTATRTSPTDFAARSARRSASLGQSRIMAGFVRDVPCRDICHRRLHLLQSRACHRRLLAAYRSLKVMCHHLRGHRRISLLIAKRRISPFFAKSLRWATERQISSTRSAISRPNSKKQRLS